jgi:hypothetical protein
MNYGIDILIISTSLSEKMNITTENMKLYLNTVPDYLKDTKWKNGTDTMVETTDKDQVKLLLLLTTIQSYNKSMKSLKLKNTLEDI